MRKKLQDYLPPILLKTYEFPLLCDTEQPEIDRLRDAADAVLDAQFISTAGETAIARYEKIFGITPMDTDTLAERRFKVLAKINAQLPFSVRRLRQQLETLCGADGYIIFKENDEQRSDLKRRIKHYLGAKKIDGLSARTLANYRSHLELFASKVTKSTAKITTDDIRGYIAFLDETRNLKDIHVQTSASHTEYEVAQYVRDRYDVKLLLVQDAGGSTGMYRASDGCLFAPEKEGVDGRPVCSVVCIKRKANVKVPKEEQKMSKKVFIGVGHGGSDSGAVGYIVEKEANLVMALACRDYLTAHGVEVRMSRTKDEEDPINEEVRECNAYNPDLAIDVHNNSGGGDGFEVYHTLNGGTGKVLAQNIEKQVIKIGQNSRGCKTRQGQRGDYYAFVRDTKCPAVICEGVFVDTKADAAQAGTKEKQQEFGIAYAKGILDTLGIKYDTSTDKPAEPTKPQDPEVQAAIEKIQTKAGLEEKTIEYLLAYKYGEQLVKKLAEAMQQ